MQARLIELQLQRGRLLERIAAQRHALRQHVAPVERVFEVGDRINQAVHEAKAFARQHPLAVAAVVVTVLVFKPRFVIRWTERGLLAWRTWRSVRALVPDLLVDRFLGPR